MKDMLLEHVMVLVAEKSPQTAAQLGQIIRKIMNEEEKRLYERIINEEQTFQRKQRVTYCENLDRFERIMGTALDAQKEVVKALAPRSPTNHRGLGLHCFSAGRRSPVASTTGLPVSFSVAARPR